MELIITKINGRFRDYSEVRSPQGYCFYDKDNKEMNYIDYIATPLLDELVIKDKFVLVEGNAEKLNEQLQDDNYEISEYKEQE